MTEKALNVLGVRVDPVNIPYAIQLLDDLIRQNGKGYVTVTGVHGIMESQRSEAVKQAHDHSYLTVPDGMPLVYIGRLLGFSQMRRCYGPDLMLAIMEESVKKGYRHFFYGGKDGVAEKLKHEMEQRFPGIQVVGTYCPPFRPLNNREESELVKLIADTRPHFFWVGLSTPKQELFMDSYLSKLDVNVMLGVGAAFDFHTGSIKSAPPWMQKMALEWLYRLLQEPKRLWRRYLINNPLFLWNLFLQTTGLKKFK